MKTIFTLKPQSFIDVITNSSSELFVCNTTKTVEFVKDILQSILNLYNLSNGSTRSFSDVFGEIYVIDESNLKSEIEAFLDWGVFPSRSRGVEIEHYEDHFEWTRNNTQNKGLDWKQESELRNEYKKGWIERNYEQAKAILLGTVLINSASDNTIPWEMFEQIERYFNAERFHLG